MATACLLHFAHHVHDVHPIRSQPAAPPRPGSLALAQASVNVHSLPVVRGDRGGPAHQRPCHPTRSPRPAAPLQGPLKDMATGAPWRAEVVWSDRT